MSTLRKILCVSLIVAVLALVCSVSSLAVDPVSAATMANAFAQAVTAYGASHGVSMMFDVSNTSGIGEQVHELWQRFRSDQQTADDYATIAAAVWPGLYSKVQRVAGAVVGINLAAEYVADLDGFWNWLLSGPAEMTKVDNQYYEWSFNQNNTVDPIIVNFHSITTLDGVEVAYKSLPETFYQVGNGNRTVSEYSSPSPDYYTMYINSGNSSNPYYFIVFSPSSMIIEATNPSGTPSLSASNGSWRWYGNGVFATNNPSDSPYNNMSSQEAYEFVSSLDSNSSVQTETTGISVQPYIGDVAPQDVYIPDNEDVNYAPLPASIPLDISWDDSLYGDGQVLTDEQSEAIAGASDLVISETGTLELADPVDVPADTPSEVYIPLLPVNLPSFNFSLSGIWHYVVSWVQSLGSWLSLMFQTWAILPSAITIPVYATAVIVIVLGVYKRFFM